MPRAPLSFEYVDRALRELTRTGSAVGRVELVSLGRADDGSRVTIECAAAYTGADFEARAAVLAGVIAPLLELSVGASLNVKLLLPPGAEAHR